MSMNGLPVALKHRLADMENPVMAAKRAARHCLTMCRQRTSPFACDNALQYSFQRQNSPVSGEIFMAEIAQPVFAMVGETVNFTD